MVRSLIPFGLVAALLSAGCVPVTEPVGAIDKAEPDRELLGSWFETKSNGVAEVFKIRRLTFDAPDVKGNPKGLMRAALKDKHGGSGDFWFSATTVGKHTYASVYFDADGGGLDGGPFGEFKKEGAYAEWKKKPNTGYFVARYTREGDALTIDWGNLTTFGALMKDEKIDGDSKSITFFPLPAGWFAKYFGKHEPQKVFDGTNAVTLEREKK